MRKTKKGKQGSTSGRGLNKPGGFMQGIMVEDRHTHAARGCGIG